MNHMQEEIRIEAPVGRVWELLCDASRWPDWSPRSKIVEISGPLDKVGTTFTQEWGLAGFHSKSLNTVVEVEPERLLHLRTEDGPMDLIYRFEPDGDATRVTIESDWQMPGHVPGFVQKLMSRAWIDRQVRQQMEDFKAIAEAPVPVPA